MPTHGLTALPLNLTVDQKAVGVSVCPRSSSPLQDRIFLKSPGLKVFLGFFSKPPDLHVMGVGRSAFSNSSGLKSGFEKLRDKQVW